MRLVVIISIVALGLLVGAPDSAQADRWPADLWERLDRGLSSEDSWAWWRKPPRSNRG